jgi:hypothetical protein
MTSNHLFTGCLKPEEIMNPVLSLACALLLLVGANGCSNLKTYPNTADKNLLVQTKMQSGSLFTGVEAVLHIYHLRGGCITDYLGTVELKKDMAPLGIMAGQPTYLKFIFNATGMLGSSTATIPYATVLTPRPGVQYSADVSYVDSIYNVVIREVDLRGTPGREIERNMGGCS